MTETLRRPDAVLFDLDGTLIDSELFAIESWEMTSAREGVAIPRAVFEAMVGTDRQGCIDRLAAVIDDDTVRQRVMNACDAVHYERLSSNVLPLKAGAVAALDWLDAAGIPYALVTSSSRREVDLKLEPDLLRRFQVVVSRNDVSRPKPDPEAYLLAARLMGVAPERCLALEDSAPGATSAFRAGVPVVVIIDIHPPMLGRDVHPRMTVRSLAEAWPALFGASLELPA